MRKLKLHKNIAFKRFLVSYILILIIPIVISSFVYVQAMAVIEDNAVNSGNFMIRQSGDIIDSYLSDIDLSVFMLSTNSTLQSVLNMPQPTFGSNKVYQLIKVINDMKSNNVSGSLDSTTYIFLEKTNVVIDNNFANYNIRDFFENSMRYDGILYEEWSRQIFDDNNNKKIIPSHRIIKKVGHNNVEYEAVTYIQSIPQGAVVVLIDTQKIRELLKNALVANNGYAFIIDSDKNIIVQNDDVDMSKIVNFKNLSLDNQPQHMEINGEDAIVFALESKYTAWHYVCVIPTNSLMGDVRHIEHTALISLFVILILGCLISIFFSRIEVKPIKEILSSLSKAISVEIRGKDEYSLIKDNISNLISKNKDMNESLNELRNVLLGQLLNGTFNEMNEARNILNNVGLSLEGKQYAVVVATINRNIAVKSLDVNALLEENVIKKIADNILLKKMKGNGSSYIIEPQQVAIILCFSTNNVDVCRRLINNYIEAINDELIQTCHIGYEFAIGNIYDSLPEVSISFFEAKVALNHFDFAETSENKIWYSDIPVSFQYYYPMDLERILANQVKGGREDELKRTLHYINKENFHDRCLSYTMQMQLFNELKATLFKICTEIKLDEMLIEVENIKMWEISSTDCLSEINDVFCRLCEIISASKKSHNQKMLDEILEYLHANYKNANISLYNISSDFKISSSYLSQFFKEQTGQNFSNYLESIRLKEACKLLGDRRITIEKITELVGYNNAYSFRRAFKRRMGRLPNEYRDSIL